MTLRYEGRASDCEPRKRTRWLSSGFYAAGSHLLGACTQSSHRVAQALLGACTGAWAQGSLPGVYTTRGGLGSGPLMALRGSRLALLSPTHSWYVCDAKHSPGLENTTPRAPQGVGGVGMSQHRKSEPSRRWDGPLTQTLSSVWRKERGSARLTRSRGPLVVSCFLLGTRGCAGVFGGRKGLGKRSPEAGCMTVASTAWEEGREDARGAEGGSSSLRQEGRRPQTRTLEPLQAAQIREGSGPLSLST